MLKYILKSIKKYYDYFIFMVLGIFVIMTIFPMGVSSLLKIKISVQGDITKYGRGEYDLLVRNEDSLTKVEKDLNLIDESYVSNGKGGISMKQYEDIKKIGGIEAAAPVANLGYFIGSAQLLSIDTPLEESNKIDVTYYTCDGPNKYKVGEAKAYGVTGKEYNQVNDEFDASKGMYKNSFYVISSGAMGSGGYENLVTSKKFKIVSFPLPRALSMLVAIDPKEENKIFTNGIYDTPGKTLENKKITQVENITDYFSGKTYNMVNKIPVVTNGEAPVRLEANINIRKLNASEESLKSIIEKYNLGKNRFIDISPDNDNKVMIENGTKLTNEMENYTDKNAISGYVNLNKITNPFIPINNIHFQCYGGKFGFPKNEKNSDCNVVAGTAHYVVNDIKYEGNKSFLSPKAIGQNNGIMIFGNKEKQGINILDICNEKNNETPIIFDEVDEIKMVDRAVLEDGPKLNGSPLGIYGGDSLVQLEDSNGKKVNRFIDQTTELGSLGKVMPNGYTTIDAAPILKGDKPIDAVRVKVGGITEYNNTSKDKIEKIATEIYNKTGLKVDFVAGSSTTKTVGQVDGIDGANGLGKIEKRWVTLETASNVTSTWNTSAFVLMIAFIVCGCLFVINRINSYMILRRREMNTLECTGWDKKYIALVITGENVLAYSIATIFSVLVLIKMNIDKKLIVLSVIIIFFIIISVSYLFTLKHKYRLKKKSYRSVSFSMTKLILSDIFRNRNRYILLMSQLILTATLGLFTLMSFNATKKAVDCTALGSQVNMSTNSIVKPIIIGSIILIIFTTFDRFTSLMIERSQEIILLKTLGWSKGKISRLMYGSLVIIGILVTIVTLAFTSLIGISFYKTIPIKGIHMIAIALAMLVICIIGGIYPIIKSLGRTLLKYNGDER